jgi:phosphoribosylaminoimidazole carboxylase (NCAIR synthetase)
MERPEENLANIRQQLAEAQQELATLEMRSSESLRHFEYRVKRHTDNILSLTIAEKVQQQQIEQEAREAEEELKKKSP